MPTESTESGVERDAELLAPPWHTAALIVVMVAVAVTGALLSSRGAAAIPSRADPSSRITTVYLPMLLVQWGLLVYVCRIGRPRSALPSLLGKRWATLGRALADIALAASGCLLVEASELVWARLFGVGQNAAMLRILPDMGSERFAWVLVSVSVGFCEEVVYRGYLQMQLTAFTRSAILAMVLQAMLFGMAHGEQGLASAIRLAFYGFGLGALAAWRRTLLPGIICHIGIDLASGLLGSR